MPTNSFGLTGAALQDIPVTTSSSGSNRLCVSFDTAPTAGTVSLSYKRPGDLAFTSAGPALPATAPAVLEVAESISVVRVQYVGRVGGAGFTLWHSNATATGSPPIATEVTLQALLAKADFPDLAVRARLDSALVLLAAAATGSQVLQVRDAVLARTDFPDSEAHALLEALTLGLAGVATDVTVAQIRDALLARVDFPDGGTHARLDSALALLASAATGTQALQIRDAVVAQGVIPGDFPDTAAQTRLAAIQSLLSSALPLSPGAATEATALTIRAAVQALGTIPTDFPDGGAHAALTTLATLLTNPLPLPAGAATQGTLAAIAGLLTNPLPLPSGAASQTTLAAVLGALSNAMPLPVGAATQATLASVLTAIQGTLAVSAASLPLPAGAATQATLAAVLAAVQGTLAVSAASLPLPVGAATQTTLASVLAALQGVLTAKPYAASGNDWTRTSDGTPITGTGAVVMKAAAGAGVRNYLTALQLANDDNTKTSVRIRDGATGTVIWQGTIGSTANGLTALQVPTWDMTFPTPLRTSANTALVIECATSGASLEWNAQGYTAA